jgi:hypothetical protein
MQLGVGKVSHPIFSTDEQVTDRLTQSSIQGQQEDGLLMVTLVLTLTRNIFIPGLDFEQP